MQAVSTQKFVRMSPRKLRLVADAVRGKSATEVLEALVFMNKRAARTVEKAIKTAVANAKVKGANAADLVISAIEVSEGPRLKRFRPVSRGQAHGYVRAMSHIKVTVATQSKVQEQRPKTKSQTTKDKKKKKEDR